MNITQTGSGFPLCFLQANMVSGRGAIVSSCVREMWVVRCCLCIHSFCIDRALAVAIALELLGQALLYQDPRPKSPDTVTKTRGSATIRVSQSDPPPHFGDRGSLLIPASASRGLGKSSLGLPTWYCGDHRRHHFLDNRVGNPGMELNPGTWRQGWSTVVDQIRDGGKKHAPVTGVGGGRKWEGACCWHDGCVSVVRRNAQENSVMNHPGCPGKFPLLCIALSCCRFRLSRKWPGEANLNNPIL